MAIPIDVGTLLHGGQHAMMQGQGLERKSTLKAFLLALTIQSKRLILQWEERSRAKQTGLSPLLLPLSPVLSEQKQ